ncbi:unnamed protein product [Leptosia nina]|uniref:Peptidase S1 domain-containing protein n=1 Tax=Leptosia nina TaxID=320188 RepID=A0AAV1J2R9_9NEOP
MLELLKLTLLLSKSMNIDAFRRIVGGRDAELGEFPYVGRWAKVHVENNQKTFAQHCTCSFLSPTWAISAAHCIDEEAPGDSVIMYGYIVRGQKQNYTEVVQMFKHPAYVLAVTYDLVRHDIGLLKTRHVELSGYGVLSAVDYTTMIGHEVFLPGYGNTNGTDVVNDATTVSKPLQVFKGMISQCKEDDGHLFSMICVVASCNHLSSVCGGDSGGPVIHASGIVGVNSLSIVDCNSYKEFKNIHIHDLAKGSSSIVQAASSVVDWVSKVVRSNP